MTTYKVGQVVTKRGKPYGTVAEVAEDGGYLVVDLKRAKYTGSDEYDDAGITPGTKVKQALIAFVQIVGDPKVQVPTFEVR